LGAKNGWHLSPTIRYFQMGDNEWNTTENWNSIASDQKILYLHPNRTLMDEPVPESFAQVKPDTIIYDPKYPSPTYGGCRLPDNLTDSTIGPRDMRDTIENRKDVLVYSTETLKDDIVLSGKLKLLLYISSNRTDTDFGIRLCDVQPDGKSVIIREGIRRARFRESYSTENLLIPNQIDSIEIEIDNLALTFKKGHKLRIDISCSDYPMFDINLNNGGALYQPGDTLIAENLIWRDQSYQSRVIIPTPKITGINDEGNNEQISVNSYKLAISPNPASVNIDIRFQLSEDSHVSSKLYDILGNEITDIINREMQSGQYSLGFNTSNITSGVYYIVLNVNSNIETKVISIIR
jgi:putative CocE/NonD family hydrolase